MEFQNKIVGITGVGNVYGIGYAIARTFLQEGAKVFICGSKPENLKKVEESLAEYGTVKAYVADVTDSNALKAMFDGAMQEFGRLDIFINNAGIYPQQQICDMTEEEWDKVMAVNLKSVFLCAKLCRETMKEGGVLINAASFATLMGSVCSGAYASSKAAVHMLTKVLAAELAPYKIRVNDYIPGVIQTQMTQPVIDARADALLGAIPMRRLGTPQEVADAVLFLASDKASYITGTSIEISGGKLCVQNPSLAWDLYE